MNEPLRLPSRMSRLHRLWRLKAARERCGWSQQELADRLGITANSVSRWERGVSAPVPHFRHQLCELFVLGPEELGLAVQSDASAPRATPAEQAAPALALPSWYIPFLRNLVFTGREELLLRLHQRLAPSRSLGRMPQALCGLAGVGKTKTALEYCYRFYHAYQAVLWARAELRETLVCDLVAIAALLGLVEAQQREQGRTLEALKGWLGAQRGWLLVLDNVEELALLNEVVPPFGQGHALLTMRSQVPGTLAQRLELAQLLEGLPLALDQAGAYVEETGCSCADYLERYQQQRSPLLERRGCMASGHPASLATTLALVIEQVQARHAGAADLLRLCAFLHIVVFRQEFSIIVSG